MTEEKTNSQPKQEIFIPSGFDPRRTRKKLSGMKLCNELRDMERHLWRLRNVMIVSDYYVF